MEEVTWKDSITQAQLNQIIGERDFWKRETKRYRDLYEIAQEELEKLRRHLP
jgi:cytidylate kinase